MAIQKPKLTGMERLVQTKERQLKTLQGQLKRLTDNYNEDAGKLKVKINDIEAIIKALKKG